MNSRLPAKAKAESSAAIVAARIGVLQRKCACGGSGNLSGKCEDCEEKGKLARKSVDSQAMPSLAPSIVHEVLASSGEHLEKEVRSQMESSLGHDFSQVRVHTDARAAESAGSVKALAYTVGDHIAFASGQYQPQTQTGRRLIAHELAHTIQQQNTSPTAQATLEIGATDNEAEREADRLADRALDQETGSVESESTNQMSALPINVSGSFATLKAGTSLQRKDDGGDPEGKPPAPVKTEGLEGEGKEPVKAEDGGGEPATAPSGGGAPAAPCDPKGLSRADYLKEPGTSTDDFGLTTLAGTAQIPVVKTSKTAKGRVLDFTDAKMPPLTSVYTKAGQFEEGIAISDDTTQGCDPGKYKVQWWILPDGERKIREGELEHCADFQYAFDISIRRYADVVNDLATTKKAFSSQKAAEKYVTGLVGPKPDTWSDVFKCLIEKTKDRDWMQWHTPHPTNRPPRSSDNCRFTRSLVGQSSLQQIGQHPSTEVIKDCGEGPPPAKGGGTGTPTKSAPAAKPQGKISITQTALNVTAGRIPNPAPLAAGPAPDADSADVDSKAAPTPAEELAPTGPEATVTEPASGLIVDDETTRLSPGQMRKTDFLAELRQAVCAAADAELVRVGRNT